jgi:hypothetical protein
VNASHSVVENTRIGLSVNFESRIAKAPPVDFTSTQLPPELSLNDDLCHPSFKPIELPDWSWRSPAAQNALRARDAGSILRLAQQYGGASQHRIANAVGIPQGRVSEILAGTRVVAALDVFERIADGLHMPDHARVTLGIAPCRTNPDGALAEYFGEVVRVFPNQAAVASDIRAHAAVAGRIDVLAVRALGILGLKDSLLRSAITGQGRSSIVRVLLTDPDSAAARVRAAEVGESAESFAAGIRLSIARLQEMTMTASIEVYLTDTLPVWRLIGCDDTLFVSAFATSWEGHESPTYKIASTVGGALYTGFRRTLEDLCDRAQRVI